MMVNGIDYVSWPRLNSLTDIIHYNGPGFRSGRHGMGVKSNGKRTVNGRIEELEPSKKRVD